MVDSGLLQDEQGMVLRGGVGLVFGLPDDEVCKYREGAMCVDCFAATSAVSEREWPLDPEVEEHV